LDAAELLPKRCVYEDVIGYVRIGSVEGGLPALVGTAVRELTSSNKLSGIVVDLRYCDGWDYAAAAGVVDLFVSREVPLLDAGKGMVASVSKTNAIHLPVAVLINRDTVSSAEALASLFRQTGAGLLVGNRTAGRAGVMSDYKLASGQTLRVMTGPIKFGDGTTLSAEGVGPDITVAVGAEAEKAFYADPHGQGRLVKSGSGEGATIPSAGSPPAKRVRLTEAELVRERRGAGEAEKPIAAGAKEETETPVIQDVALARAVDMLKALAVVRQGRL
jgi:C-terminal processing protease CtpA/Prc